MKKILKNVKELSKKEKGITLIALVITIVILLILAATSISMLNGDNGILSKAGQARDDTIVGEEKEQVELAYISAAIKKLGVNVDKDDLQDELDVSVGEDKTTVTGSETLKVKFEETENEYTVSQNGIVAKIKNIDELSDLEKVQMYFVGKSWDDFGDDEKDGIVYKDIVPILDASESIEYVNDNENSTYIKYNNNIYILKYNKDTGEVLSVENGVYEVIGDENIYLYDIVQNEYTTFSEIYIVVSGEKIDVSHYIKNGDGYSYIKSFELRSMISNGSYYEVIITKDAEEYKNTLKLMWVL